MKGTPKKLVIGHRFGKLLILAEREPSIYSTPNRPRIIARRVFCRCDCGVEREFSLSNLRSGESSSCGCVREGSPWKAAHGKPLHGHRAHGGRTPEYVCWVSLKARCENRKCRDYKDYGARGIGICDRWRGSFEAFLSDMGNKPTPKHSIDRINNDGNYEPGNCRWATAKEQRANQRNSKKASLEAPV